VLSRTTRYALEVLRCMAREPAARVAADRLSQETGIPANYLSKILDRLRQGGVVEGERGWRGGFRLRPDALDRPIRSISEIFEKRRARAAPEGCIFGLRRCDGSNPCALHAQWEQLCAAREALLTSHTLRDLLTKRPELSS